MSLKSNKTSQMSLNRRNGDRNRDRCHGIVEIVTDVEMAIVPPISPTCSSIDDQRPRMEARRLTQAAAADAAEKIQMCDTNPDYPRRDVSAQAALTRRRMGEGGGCPKSGVIAVSNRKTPINYKISFRPVSVQQKSV